MARDASSFPERDTTALAPLVLPFFRVAGDTLPGIAVLPLVDFSSGWSSRRGAIWQTRAGGAVTARAGRRCAMYAEVIGGLERTPAYIQAFKDSLGVLPSVGRFDPVGGAAANALPQLRVAYTPSPYFELEAGFGRHFVGHGYRSLFLSDVAMSYPYLRITTDVWHVKYTNLFAMQRDIRPELPHTATRRKYTSTHHLSWAVGKRFSVGIFESIVWQARDTALQRGFDPNYLNPIIFYRPVEFAIGSPDNVLLGMNLAWEPLDGMLLYGQLLLDEFLLSEFRARNGWWANKWGTQLGAKWRDAGGVRGLCALAEFNLVRPFTYTHGSVLQNFGHYYQPLAHPLGTNFYEWVVRAYREWGKWYGEFHGVHAVYGRDPEGQNLGGDIYSSYANPSMQYGNTLAQGIQHRLWFATLSGGLILHKGLNLRASAHYTLRQLRVAGTGRNAEHIVGISFATAIYSAYRDF
jgi:hypothetical protein